MGTPKRYKVASVLLLLAPLSGSLGTWLLFFGLPPIGAELISFPGVVVQVATGIFFFLVGFLLLVSSLGAFASENNVQAEKWLRWLGRWKPSWPAEGGPSVKIESSLERYRGYVLAMLGANLILALLLVPGIGEERQFPLNQFSSFILSAWYFYALTILLAALVVVYKKRRGGYYLCIFLSAIVFGTNISDILGLLPPSAPLPRALILQLTTLPPAGLQALLSWRALRSVDHVN